MVTGGAGFIGSNFCDYVLKQQEVTKLYILDKFTYAGMPESISEALNDSRTELLEGDICDAESFTQHIHDCDIVFNFAAESHVDNSIESPDEFIRTNIIGTHKLLKVVQSSNKNPRFLQVSTDEVYGSLSFEDESSTEESPLKPSSPYSASKAGADNIVYSYHVTYGMDTVITRSTNNFGPKQFPEKLIPKVIYNAQNNINIPVYGDGLNTRDWIFVEDNCKGVWLAGTKGQSGEIYHLGSSNEINNITIVKTILNILGKDESLIEFVKDRLGHDLRYSLSTKKSEKDLGWKANLNFEEDLKKTIEWYSKNTAWLDAANKKIQQR